MPFSPFADCLGSLHIPILFSLFAKIEAQQPIKHLQGYMYGLYIFFLPMQSWNWGFYQKLFYTFCHFALLDFIMDDFEAFTP